jgi:hypothetical protein
MESFPDGERMIICKKAVVTVFGQSVEKEKLKSILGCIPKPTISVDPTALVLSSRLVGTVGPQVFGQVLFGRSTSI